MEPAIHMEPLLAILLHELLNGVFEASDQVIPSSEYAGPFLNRPPNTVR